VLCAQADKIPTLIGAALRPGCGSIRTARTGFIPLHLWFDRARPEDAEGFTTHGFSVVRPELAEGQAWGTYETVYGHNVSDSIGDR
jgi:hypothetical protein